ncbi:RNA polymerase sigma-70 factor [Pedobacter glucosidilyticus]|jgi:RNA polymerase sigma-70 factor (ECF subfamily)|uniref:RNA polymerase sigma-70 factor n=1 Tax=Pedobacter glucosidilyticus TaxID=1122941 RepID=UPI000416B118|nr:RNA polymerase sigma-70 factor [Pedobacter glucosidilyticus]
MTEEKSKVGSLDKKKFKEIFNENYQSLFFLGRNYLEDEDEAKGVVQEAFVKLWDIWEDLKEDTNHRNFLFKMVKNNCLNILKRRQLLLKHHEKIKSLELHYQYESLNRIGFDYLQVKELKEKIDLSIKNLPEHCRIVFELSRFEQLKNREIAERLGVSQKTVEAHLTKALKILRSDLKEYLPLLVFLTRLLR